MDMTYGDVVASGFSERVHMVQTRRDGPVKVAVDCPFPVETSVLGSTLEFKTDAETARRLLSGTVTVAVVVSDCPEEGD